jgi:hypothetical protein
VGPSDEGRSRRVRAQFFWSKNVVNGGIIATVIDCHCVCTAITAAYRCSLFLKQNECAGWEAVAACVPPSWRDML